MRKLPAWADAKAPRNKTARNDVELPRYSQIERKFSIQAQNVIAGFQGGELTRSQAMNAFRQNLRDAETHAFVAGRRARGDVRDHLSQAEEQMLSGRHSRNMRYFSRFLGDVEAGRGRLDYGRRADQYAKSLWSLYTRGETSDFAGEDNARYHWILDPDAEHCLDCIDRARQSRDADGFTWEQLTEIGWPGENTICRINCRCHIRTVNKRMVLPERLESLEPAATPDEGVQIFEQLLGGVDLPLQLPAAGLPYVKISGERMAESIAAAGDASEELMQVLPVVPKALVQPDFVVDLAPDLRRFFGQGLQITAQREDGIWWVWLVLLDEAARKSA